MGLNGKCLKKQSLSNNLKISRIPQIDILKAFAIIAVILLHALPENFFLSIGSPYHLWQAVPIFVVIAGFTSAYALLRYGSISLKQCYDISVIIRRYKRLLIPFFICWIIEIVLLSQYGQISLDPLTLILNFLSGGSGWGAYFVALILQSVLIIPFFYFLAVRTSPEKMLAISLVLSLVFDAVIVFLSWPAGCYGFPQFLFAAALGIWIVTTKERRPFWLISGGIVSLIYITVACYTPFFANPNFSGYIGILQTPSFIWAAILVLLGLKYLPASISKGCGGFAEIGKASWHIFLIQLLYYFLPAAYVYAFFIKPIASGNLFLTDILIVICNILICVGLGYLWYSSEKAIILKIKGD